MPWKRKASPLKRKEASKKSRPLVIGDMAVSRAREKRSTARNPFTLPDFPPNVVPKDKSHRMAMDDAFGWAGSAWGGWASIISGIFAEGLVFPGYSFLAEQAQRPEYRRFAEVIATEMTRKWIRIQSIGGDDKTDKIKLLTDELDRLQARDHFRRCIELDELFGRSHLYIDTGETENREELKTALGNGRDTISRLKIGKDSVKALRPVEPVWVYPTSYDAIDPLTADWYEPQTWFVMGKEVHSSRLLKFVGREVPDLLKPAYSFGGLSMTQMSKPYVDNWLRTRQSVADLIHAFSVFVLKTDLGTTLMEGADELFRRIELFNSLRDNRGLMMVNKDSEELSNVSAPLGGLDQLQAQTQEHLAAVSGIPIVKLLGIQPTGLNASDEGGIRMFYDWVLASQEKRMRVNLTKVIDFVQLSIWGEVDQEITFTFEPLYALDDKALAEVREVDARTNVALIDAGVVSPQEVREKIASDPDSPFASIDVEEVPDLRTEEMSGLDPRAGGGEKGIGKPPRLLGGEGKEQDEEGNESDDALFEDPDATHLDPDYLEGSSIPPRQLDPEFLAKRGRSLDPEYLKDRGEARQRIMRGAGEKRAEKRDTSAQTDFLDRASQRKPGGETGGLSIAKIMQMGMKDAPPPPNPPDRQEKPK